MPNITLMNHKTLNPNFDSSQFSWTCVTELTLMKQPITVGGWGILKLCQLMINSKYEKWRCHRRCRVFSPPVSPFPKVPGGSSFDLIRLVMGTNSENTIRIIFYFPIEYPDIRNKTAGLWKLTKLTYHIVSNKRAVRRQGLWPCRFHINWRCTPKCIATDSPKRHACSELAHFLNLQFDRAKGYWAWEPSVMKA